MPRLTHIGARAAAQGVTLRPVKARPPTTGVWQHAYAKRLRILHQAWADHVETIGRRYLGARADGFDPDEPRDPDGKWSGGGGGGRAIRAATRLRRAQAAHAAAPTAKTAARVVFHEREVARIAKRPSSPLYKGPRFKDVSVAGTTITARSQLHAELQARVRQAESDLAYKQKGSSAEFRPHLVGVPAHTLERRLAVHKKTLERFRARHGLPGGDRADAFDPNEPRDADGKWSGGKPAYKATGRGGGGIIGRAKVRYGELMQRGQFHEKGGAGDPIDKMLAAKAFKGARMHEARVGRAIKRAKAAETETAGHDKAVHEARAARKAALHAVLAAPEGPAKEAAKAAHVKSYRRVTEAIKARRVARNKVLALRGNRHGDSREWRTDGLEDDLKAAYDALVKASGLDAFLGRFAGGISDANRAYVKRVTRLPPGNVARQQIIEDFRRENVALIKGLSDYQATQVADTLRVAQATGARWEDVQPDIQERLGVSMSRAKLIARDQTNKFSGAMQQVHQTASGITEYTWMTMNDMAVRGRPGGEYAKSKDKHWPLHGTRQRWDSPPLVPGTGERMHPGQDIQCRCQAIPVVSFFEDT